MSPKAGEGGAIPRGSHYAHLGAAGALASGRAEVRPQARGSRLDVHTELFVYVGAPLGPKKWCIRPPPAAVIPP